VRHGLLGLPTAAFVRKFTSQENLRLPVIRIQAELPEDSETNF
jgi:hypothetical protein